MPSFESFEETPSPCFDNWVPFNPSTTEYVERRGLSKSSRYPYHPDFTPAKYFAPENEWVRRWLKSRRFRIDQFAPDKVVRFVFYLELCAKDLYSFRQTYFACRMNYKYFLEFRRAGISTRQQDMYVDAVYEASTKATCGRFEARERFLDMFTRSFMSLHKLSETELAFCSGQIANRNCKKYTVEYQMLKRKMESHIFRHIQAKENRLKDPEKRKALSDYLTEKCFLEQLIDRKDPQDPKYKYDLDIMARLVVQLEMPWTRDEEAQAMHDHNELNSYYYACLMWDREFHSIPKVDKAAIESHRMDEMADLLKQIKLIDEDLPRMPETAKCPLIGDGRFLGQGQDS